MKNLIRILLSTMLLINSVAFAQVSNGRRIDGTNAPGLSSEKNYVINGSCEKNATTGLAASGGSLSRGTTTPLNEDTGTECVVDASSSGQTYTWSLNTFGERLNGGNCAAEFIYQGDASLYKAYVNNGSTKITNDLTLLNISSGAKAETINFPCGDLSASNTFVIESTSSSAAAVSVIVTHVGKARNIGSVSQAKQIGDGYFATTASCTWSRTNTAIGAFSTTSACPGPTVLTNSGPGTIQTTDADLPKFTVNNLPAGFYEVQFFADVTGDNAASSAKCLAINDGTTTSQANCGHMTNTSALSMVATGSFNYTSSGNRTFELYGSAGANGITVEAQNTNRTLYFKINYFPSADQTAVTLNQLSAPTVTKYTTAGTGTWTRPAGVTHVRVRMVGAGGGGGGSSTSSNAGAAGDGTASTFTCSGNVTTAGGGIKGIEFGQGGLGGSPTITAPAVGTGIAGGQGGAGLQYNVSGTNLRAVGGNGGSSALGGAGGGGELGNGTTATANSGSGGGGASSPSSLSASAGSGGGSGAFIDVIYPNVPSSCSYQVGTKGSAGTAGTGGNAGAAGSDGYVEFTEYYGYNMPLLIGGVTSNTSGMERIERATIVCGSSSSITSQTGSWISTVGNISGNRCALTFASGMFTSTPTCWGSYAGTSTSIGYSITVNPTSVTAATIGGVYNNAGSNTAFAGPDTMNVFCMGPR